MRRFSLLIALVGLLTALAVGVRPISVHADDDHTAGSHEGEHDYDHADGEADHHEEGHGEGGHGEGDHGDDHGAGHGDVDYNRPPLNPEMPLLIWSLVVFVGFLLLAKKMAWAPLIDGLNAREARVNQALADAEAARIEAQKLLADHQKHLDSVTEEVKEIVAKARTEAEQEKARIIAEAEAETTAMRDEAIADIHAAHEQALSEMDNQIDDQVAMATRHVLG